MWLKTDSFRPIELRYGSVENCLEFVRLLVLSALVPFIDLIAISAQVGDVKKSDLPGPEALDDPGQKEGSVKMIRAINGTVEAYQVRLARICSHSNC